MERQKRRKKSCAKMAGVKSTFVIDSDLLMTSFGERDKAVREKYIAQGNVKSLRKQEQAFDAQYGKEKICYSDGSSNEMFVLTFDFFDNTDNYDFTKFICVDKSISEDQIQKITKSFNWD